MPLIDQNQYQALCDLAAGDGDFIVSVLDAFLPQLVSVPVELRQAFGDGDCDEVAKRAHSLKGSAANVGAADVSTVCKAIEAAARRGDLAEVAPFLAELDERAAATHDAFREEKARLT